MHMIDVDVVDLQALERLVDLLHNALAGDIAGASGRRFAPDQAAFGGDNQLFPVIALNRIAHHLFRIAAAVDGGRINDVHIVIQHGTDGRNGIVAVHFAPAGTADGPCTHRGNRDIQPGFSQNLITHTNSLLYSIQFFFPVNFREQPLPGNRFAEKHFPKNLSSWKTTFEKFVRLLL